MKYIAQNDYDYITSKYHDVNHPFNSFRRFIRRDELFSEDSGMAPQDILDGIIENDKKNINLPHPIRKANALAYVLKNTRISCDPRDIFPAINMVDRPLIATLVNRWKKEVFDLIIPETGKKRRQLETDGIVTIWPDYAHSVPYWDRIFSLGFCGLLAESEAAHRSKEWTPEQDAFFEGIRITYEAILCFIGGLEKLARKTAGSERLAAALASIKQGAPQTFYEALLVDYLFFMISEHVDCMQVRSLCNFDRLFYGYYTNDLKNGVSEEQIRRDLAYFFLQFTA
ncbi:MAG: hypothetical protein IJF33_03655, partial [Clostridia bacterium]|nr:hypothetical protein [Clostridia bacterium]